MDEPGAFYAGWSKLGRERQNLCINTYIWNLEIRYPWFYFQHRKGDTDVKSRLLDSVGEDERGMTWENSIEHVLYLK